MKRKLWMLLVSILFLGMLAACGTTNDENVAEDMDGNSATDLPAQAGDENAPPEQEEGTEESSNQEEEGTEDTPNNEAKEESEEKEADTIKAEVTYTGLIDTHSIEVRTDDGGILVLQIAPDTMNQWGKLAPNTSLTVEYYTNQQGQNILVDHTIKN